MRNVGERLSLIAVDLKEKTVSLNSRAGISEVFYKGLDPREGITNAQISNQSADVGGNIHFTLSVFGLNGQSAAGNPLAPQSWIEYTFNFIVDPKETVVVEGGKAKVFPSISIFSYSNGKSSNLWEQTESKDVRDLDKPARSINIGPPKADPIQEDMERQCQGGNRAACP